MAWRTSLREITSLSSRFVPRTWHKGELGSMLRPEGRDVPNERQVPSFRGVRDAAGRRGRFRSTSGGLNDSQVDRVVPLDSRQIGQRRVPVLAPVVDLAGFD